MLRFLIGLFLTQVALANFDWQGHRGARGIYPENTINGMGVALKYPVTTLEMDVVLSKDHKVVVSHEPWLSEEICLKARGREFNLYKMNYEEIKKFDCGSKTHPRFPDQQKVPEYRPLLSELLEKYKSSGKNFNIEIKSTPDDEQLGYQPDVKTFSDEVMKVIRAHLSTSQYSVQSFDWRVLKYLHEKYPDVKLVALRETPYKAADVLAELGFTPAIFSPDFTMLTAADVAFFHEKNVKVIPWTVNTTGDMKKIIAMNVDGIITDYPNLIKDIPVELYLQPDCKKNFNRFEGKCIRIPKHGLPSEQNPGWVCKTGYLQKRAACIKIKVPKNAVLLNDGKTWVCRDGYERYRYTCKKL